MGQKYSPNPNFNEHGWVVGPRAAEEWDVAPQKQKLLAVENMYYYHKARVLVIAKGVNR